MKFLLVLCFLVMGGVAECAAKEITAFSVTPMAGAHFFAGSHRLDTGPLLGIKVGYDVIGPTSGGSIGIEGGLGYVPTSSKTDGGSRSVYLLRLDALYPFWPKNRLVPFIAVGVGGIFVSGGDGSQDPLVNYGGGIKYYLTDAIAVRSDIRHIIVFDDDHHSDYEITAGVSFTLFGGEKNLRRVPIADSDRDGVPDPLDRCPGTPRGIKVDKDGCPLDTDGDGVPDSLDKCPKTVKGAKVDARGCPEATLVPAKPSDTPSGSAPPAAPKTPEPPPASSGEALLPPVVGDDPAPEMAETAEEAAGGVVEPEAAGKSEGTPNLPRPLLVEFDFDSPTLRPIYRDQMIQVARFLAANPVARATVSGHTDGKGASRYNLELSRKRAESVRDFLVHDQGVSTARIRIEYFGVKKPIAGNDTMEGRQKNRRVTVQVDPGPPPGPVKQGR